MHMQGGREGERGGGRGQRERGGGGREEGGMQSGRHANTTGLSATFHLFVGEYKRLCYTDEREKRQDRQTDRQTVLCVM